jgi:hypothetical protein
MSGHQLSENTYVIPDSAIIMDKFMNTKTNIRIIRKCSFCNCEGHNVSRCNDHALINFHNYLIYYKNNNIVNESSNQILNTILTIEKVEQFLYDFCKVSETNIKLLKSYACRYCNSRIRSLLYTTINKIIVHLFDLNYNYLFDNYEFVLLNSETTLRISAYLSNILIDYLIYNENAQPIIDNHKFEVVINHSYDEKTNENECAICYNKFHIIECASFVCNHDFCIDCTMELIKTRHKTCPCCRSDIEKITCYNKQCYDKIKNIL